jgi:alkyl hydroperoxide reductase subunit AhpC
VDLDEFQAKEGSSMTARVGKPAPEFQTKSYTQGEIKTVALPEYRGKWVMLYFYPGDFTFV